MRVYDTYIVFLVLTCLTSLAAGCMKGGGLQKIEPIRESPYLSKRDPGLGYPGPQLCITETYSCIGGNVVACCAMSQIPQKQLEQLMKDHPGQIYLSFTPGNLPQICYQTPAVGDVNTTTKKPECEKSSDGEVYWVPKIIK